MKVYIATNLSNCLRAAQCDTVLTELGYNITYRWWNHGRVSSKADLLKCGLAELEGVLSSDVLLFITPANNGSHVEFGLALAKKIPIVMLCEDGQQEEKTFYNLPGVFRYDSATAALLKLSELRENHVGVYIHQA